MAGCSGYKGEDKGRGWVEKALGWSVELVERRRKPAPEEILKLWSQEWSKEGVAVNRKELLPPKGFQALPKPWVVERSVACTEQEDEQTLGEAAQEQRNVYQCVAMGHLMVRRLTRS